MKTSTLNWEEHFIQEAVELEECMKSLTADQLNQSKLRICLDAQILDWNLYEKWSMTQYGCSSLKAGVGQKDLEKFIPKAREAQEAYSNYDFWNEDLIPFFVWEEQLVVVGLQFNEKLVALENSIFILAPPSILSFISSRVATLAGDPADEYVDSAITDHEGTKALIDGIEPDVAKPTFDFGNYEPVSLFDNPLAASVSPSSDAPASNSYISLGTPQIAETSDPMWDFISERHQENSYEVRKQFDAFVVLKVKDKKTSVFKMDQDLSKQGVNTSIFEYNLDAESPFKNVADSGQASSFTMLQLKIKLPQYKHACIVPLRRGKKTLGFYVGFKKDSPSAADQNLLEELALETAS